MSTVLRSGSHGDAVRKLQRALTHLDYKPGAIDGVFGPRVEDAVEAFQNDHDLYVDGIAGPMTFRVLDPLVPIEFRQDQGEAPLAPPTSPATLLGWEKCPADKIPNRDGYTTTTLRSDTAVAYRKLYEAAHHLGGVITSAGGRRALSSKAGANRSKTSMHYVGRAFDMALPTGLVDPNEDPYVMVRAGDTRYWTVWCRSTGLSVNDLADRCGELGIRGGQMTLEATYLSRQAVKNRTVVGNFFDFTALAAKFDFHRIPARKAFFESGQMTAAEWWHFGWESGLTPGKTTFGEELLRVYTPEEAEKFVYWTEAKDAVWRRSWFG